MRRTKRLKTIIRLMLIVVLAAQIRVAGTVAAEVASAPSLVISQLKVTSSNGQFITLYNATNTQLDMGKFQLEYFNNYDLARASSSKLISLTGTVPPHGYYVVSDDSFLLCYRQTVDSVSLGLSSSAGLVEVLAYAQTAPGGSATPVLQDFVGWSKTDAAGAQTLPGSTAAFLLRQPVDASGNPAINYPGTGSWQAVQPGGASCSYTVISSDAPVQSGPTDLLPPSEPAATVVSQIANTVASPSLPASDAGLMSPLITEILPNPAGTGNDSTDEFIEVYNPNPAGFDLSGFGLEAGTTSLHDFTFPDGTGLPAESFKAFYASSTGLSLSNSGGQVKLLDPAGKQLSATAVYDKAADGQAWALANGQWYWTTRLTPGAPNIVAKSAAKTKSSSSKKTKSKANALASKAVKSSAKNSSAGASGNNGSIVTSPIHTSALAVVAGLALLYGLYEYRADLANRFHQFRRNLKFGGGHGA